MFYKVVISEREESSIHEEFENLFEAWMFLDNSCQKLWKKYRKENISIRSSVVRCDDEGNESFKIKKIWNSPDTKTITAEYTSKMKVSSFSKGEECCLVSANSGFDIGKYEGEKTIYPVIIDVECLRLNGKSARFSYPNGGHIVCESVPVNFPLTELDLNNITIEQLAVLFQMLMPITSKSLIPLLYYENYMPYILDEGELTDFYYIYFSGVIKKAEKDNYIKEFVTACKEVMQAFNNGVLNTENALILDWYRKVRKGLSESV